MLTNSQKHKRETRLMRVRIDNHKRMREESFRRGITASKLLDIIIDENIKKYLTN